MLKRLVRVPGKKLRVALLALPLLGVVGCQGVDDGATASENVSQSHSQQHSTPIVGWQTGGYNPLPSTEEGADYETGAPDISPSEASEQSAPDLYSGGGATTSTTRYRVGSNVVDSGFILALGQTEYTSTSARSGKASVSGQTIESELCSAGSAMTGYTVYYANWVAEASITAVDLICTNVNTGATSTRTLGVKSSGVSWAGRYFCNLGPWVTGVSIIEDDEYLLDLHPRCGTEQITQTLYSDGTSTFRFGLEINSYYYYYYSGRNDPFTDETRVECASGQVMVGLRAKYRRDSNEAAITELKGICAPVTASPET